MGGRSVSWRTMLEEEKGCEDSVESVLRDTDLVLGVAGREVPTVAWGVGVEA